MFFPFLWHNFNSQGNQVLKPLAWVLTQEREFIESSSGWGDTSSLLPHIKKSVEYPESESSGLLENNSFSFLCWATCKEHSCFLFPKYCEAVGFFGWEMSVSGSSRAETTVNWEHPSIGALPPTEMEMNSRQFVNCVCFLEHWRNEEEVFKCVLSSVEEERGENGPYELSLNYAESMKVSFTEQLVSPCWVPVKPSGL